MLATIFLSAFFFLFQTPTTTPRQTDSQRLNEGQQRQTTSATQSEEPPVVKKQSVTIQGKTLNYTTTTGYLPIKNSVTGETEAKMFFIAYTLDNPPSNRPLMFSFNGGPGSASVWLHLGALGPKRVKMLDDGLMPPPPYQLIDNDQTWFTETDLVFIDPVGTGYSRATRPELGTKFFGVQGDLDSVTEFIRLYLGRYERWNSPLFLVGESYGTLRASGLSNTLFEKGISLNGILLVSTVMNYGTLNFADGNNLPYVLIFPSYAATAWYHKRLSADLQRKPLKDVVKEAEDFAGGELTIGLAKGDRLTDAERQSLLDKFARYTGLSKTFITNNDFKVELGRFNKELLRDQQRTTGRLDSRFTGIDRDVAGSNTENDPSMSAIRPPYTAAFNDYVRRDLGFKSDLEYYILGGGIGRWDFGQGNSYTNTAPSLQSAMQKNPYMKIFVGQGYYDMATPFFAAEYTVANMNLDPSLRKNITVNYYEAGHMMYIEKNSLKKLKDDAARFIQNSLQK
jgi:carboxypeptidase C (cathepsin A)